MNTQIRYGTYEINFSDTTIKSLPQDNYSLFLSKKMFGIIISDHKNYAYTCDVKDFFEQNGKLVVFSKDGTTVTLTIRGTQQVLLMPKLSTRKVEKVKEKDIETNVIDYITSEHKELQFIGRQVQTEVGILDLLYFKKELNQHVILELKNKKLNLSDVDQGSRYLTHSLLNENKRVILIGLSYTTQVLEYGISKGVECLNYEQLTQI